MNIEEMVAELKELNDKANSGRGITCVRAIISYLQKGDYPSAKTVADTDFDKLYQYEDLGIPQAVARMFDLKSRIAYFANKDDCELSPASKEEYAKIFADMTEEIDLVIEAQIGE